MFGERVDKKATFFVVAIFAFAFMGAFMSSGEYNLGEEVVVTGHAVEASSDVNVGFFGIILAFIALAGLVCLGLFVFGADKKEKNLATPKVKTFVPVPAIPVMSAAEETHTPKLTPKANLKEVSKVDKEIDLLSKQLEEINSSLK